MFLNKSLIPPFLNGQSVIFFGEDFNLGRRTDLIMSEADFRIINSKQPDQLNLSGDAKIDAVFTADSQSTDYLVREGTLYCEINQTLFIKVNKLIVALLKVEASEEFLEGKIADIRRKADIVIATTIEQIETFGKKLIDCGADVVFGRQAVKRGVETYKQRPIIYNATSSGGFLLVISKKGVEQIFYAPPGSENEENFLDDCRKLNTDGISEGGLAELKFTPPARAEEILEPIELTTAKYDGKSLFVNANTPSVITDSDIATFRQEFKAGNGNIFFMLRAVKAEAPGIEISAFRRAKFFKKYLGVKVTLITHEYQYDLQERCEDYKIDSPVLNMYDYFQEINRATEKTCRTLIEPMHEGWSIERNGNDLRICRQDGTLAMYCVFAPESKRLNYINFFNDKHKKIRRDCYDALGFLSCRQELDPETELEKEIFYFRPDGTVAVHEIYKLGKDKSIFNAMELVDRKGNVIKTFANHDEALSYWLLQLVSDKEKNYFLIGDRTPEWNQAYIDIKEAELDNVRVIHQLHSLHTVNKNNMLTAPTNDNYRYLTDKKIKADAIVALTEQQRSDIISRYNLSDIFAIPHPLQKFVVDKKTYNPLLVVMVGRIVSAKGHAKAIEAFKIVADKIPQAKLYFYGTGILQTELQKKIEELYLERSIIFKGFASNVAEIFSSAALSICTSEFEGFSLAVQESLQNNCPVVSFDCPYGPRDMIEEGVNGYLVQSGDIEAMADRIIKILTEPGLRDKLSANCAQSVEKFSPNIVANKWAKLLCKLMYKSKEE